jgi:hypothetical protein
MVLRKSQHEKDMSILVDLGRFVLLILMYLFFRYWFKRLFKTKSIRLQELAITATAEVIKVVETGFNQGDDAFAIPILELQVIVKGEEFKGAKIYVKKAFHPNEFPEVGDYVKISIDPKDFSSALILSVY